MDIKLATVATTVLCLIGCIHFINGTYVIVSPETIRPGLPLVISVNIEATSPFTLLARITKNTVSIADRETSYDSSFTGTIELQVPNNAEVGGLYELSVTGSGGVTFSEKKTLKFVAKGFSIFIQTDKAIYKPGQTINYRIFAVNPDLSQRMENFDIEIKDPKDNLIQQKTNYVPPSSGVVTEELVMSTQPPLGDWIITVTAGDVSTYQVFTVAEYVLPKFKVFTTLPTFITRADTTLQGRVDAQYTYGKPVKGTVTIRISAGRKEIQIDMPIDGSKSFSVPLTELPGMYDSAVVLVTATVIESLTGNEQNSTSSTLYYNRPVKVTILDATPKTYKPGLNYTAYIAVTKQDGSPLSDTERAVQLGITFYNGEFTFYDIPSSGVVMATIRTVSNIDPSQLEINARYYTEDQEPGATGPYVARLSVDPFKSPSNSSIQIGLSTSQLNAGESTTFIISYTKTPPQIAYMILSKNKVITMATMSGLTPGSTMLTVDITADMAPLAKMIVYYVTDSGEVVVDAFNFNVDGAFKNLVSLSFSSEVVEPGDDINVDVTATGGSHVCLLAVDQSVLLLKSGNDITQQKVLTELETFDGSNVEEDGDGFPGDIIRPFWFYPRPPKGTSAADIFDDAGVIVITNATIPRTEPEIDYRFYLAAMPEVARFPVHEAAGDFDTETEIVPAPGADPDPPVRTEFPETWLWMDSTIGADGTLSVQTKVPDTITSWVGSAFALSSETGLGVVPKTSMVTVFKPFFVSMNLPYSVIRGEQLALEVLVFNYQTTDINAEIKLHKSDDFDNIELNTGNDIDAYGNDVHVSKDQIIRVRISAGDGVSVSFPIIPKNLKLMDIQVTAQSSTGMDSVIRQLLVEPEGVTRSYTSPELIDLTDSSITKSFFVDLPPTGLVEGSVYVKLSATGDIMGPTMSGLDELLRMPSGCGEQNMIGFAPDVFIYQYLTSTGQNNQEIKEKALRYMMIGYQKELTYQHKDGSFSAFGESDPSGSTWLSAFVVKSFVQAKDFIDIDMKLVEKTIGWILGLQNADGSFPEPGKICHRDMQGGVSGPVTLTAYVMVALQEAMAGNLQQKTLDSLAMSVNKAGAYIESEFANFGNDPYVLAITTYALTLSGRPSKDMFLQALEALAIEEDGMKHWSRQGETEKPKPEFIWSPPYCKPPSSDVEMTGYGLLIYLARDDTIGGSSISKWLSRQRSEIGGYSSTQDTVVALQALSSYASKVTQNRGEITIDVTATEDPAYQPTLTINSNNALVFQQLEVPVSSGFVNASVVGSGSIIVQFTVSYNVKEVEQEPPFDVTITVIDSDTNNIQITVCGQYLLQQQSGMSIMDIGIPSGFAVNEDKVKDQLMAVATLQKYEFQKRSAILYLDEITFGSSTCVTITAYRSNIVSNIKPSPVKVYNYYQPDEQITKFYVSDALSSANIRDLCPTCGEAVSLSETDTTAKPSAGRIHSSPNPCLLAVIVVGLTTGLMLGVKYHI